MVDLHWPYSQIRSEQGRSNEGLREGTIQEEHTKPTVFDFTTQDVTLPAKQPWDRGVRHDGQAGRLQPQR